MIDSPQSKKDGTLSYFNNMYRAFMENPADGEIHYCSSINPQKHQAKVGGDGVWTSSYGTRKQAEIAAITDFIRNTGGETEVRLVCTLQFHIDTVSNRDS